MKNTVVKINKNSSSTVALEEFLLLGATRFKVKARPQQLETGRGHA